MVDARSIDDEIVDCKLDFKFQLKLHHEPSTIPPSLRSSIIDDRSNNAYTVCKEGDLRLSLSMSPSLSLTTR
jgi:hypothetical protein